jgi:hypothetical protein
MSQDLDNGANDNDFDEEDLYGDNTRRNSNSQGPTKSKNRNMNHHWFCVRS